MRFRALMSFAVLLAATSLASAADRFGRLDTGLLDPEWLGVAGKGEWRNPPGIDYLWVKPGFSLEGRTIVLEEWTAPTFLNGERDRDDSRTAMNLSDSMPGRLQSALSVAGVSDVSRTPVDQQKDLRITGRIVDCNAGSRALRWMSGSSVVFGNATWDIKIVDAATGETVAAVHHRSVSGADSHNLGEKMNLWLNRVFAPALRAGFDVYDKARPVRE